MSLQCILLLETNLIQEIINSSKKKNKKNKYPRIMSIIIDDESDSGFSINLASKFFKEIYEQPSNDVVLIAENLLKKYIIDMISEDKYNEIKAASEYNHLIKFMDIEYISNLINKNHGCSLISDLMSGNYKSFMIPLYIIPLHECYY